MSPAQAEIEGLEQELASMTEIAGGFKKLADEARDEWGKCVVELDTMREELRALQVERDHYKRLALGGQQKA